MILTVGILTGILEKLNFSSSDVDTYKAGKMDGFAFRHLIWGAIVSNLYRVSIYLPHLMIVSITYFSFKYFLKYYIVTLPALLLVINPTIILYGQTLLRDFLYFPLLIYIFIKMHEIKWTFRDSQAVVIILLISTLILVMNPIFTLTISGALFFVMVSHFFGVRLTAILSLIVILITLLSVDNFFHDISVRALHRVANTDQTCGNLGLANLETEYLSIFIFSQIFGNLLVFNSLDFTVIFKLEHLLFLGLSIYALSKKNQNNSYVHSFAYGILFIGIFQLTGENCEWSLIRHKIILYAPLFLLLCKRRDVKS